jgi:hypothetical protein
VALTQAQRLQVRFYLGWSDRYFQSDTRLEWSMDNIDARPDTEAKVIALIAKAVAKEAQIEAATSRLKALKVGTIDLPGEREIMVLRDLGRQVSNQMASILGVGCKNDIWSGTLPDDFDGWEHHGSDNSVRQG